MEPIVSFINVTKTYDGRNPVVRSLNLEVRRGEFLTMLGPSGSGKTTSLMMLAGFEAPTSGEILLEGQTLSKLPPYKRDIGMVFQNYALFPHMTIADNIAFPLRVRRLSAADIGSRVERALQMVRLPHVAKRRPAELSGGQQQRIALARALVYEPKIVLMDEPLGALDRQLRENMQHEIRSIHEDLGLTVVYVTHDQGEALTMSDRIAVFNGGDVEQLATPQELYEHPFNAFVASFVGENNLIKGRVIRFDRSECEVDLGSGRMIARTADLRDGSAECIVSVRPEKVISKGRPGERGMNTVPAVLEAITYLGDHLKLIFRLRDGQILTAKEPISAGSQSYKPGDEMAVSWSSGDCFAFEPLRTQNQAAKIAEPARQPAA